MFTGIIDHCGVITEIQAQSDSLALAIHCAWDDFQLGESIAVDGICLTVTQCQGQTFYCDISPETFRLTTASQFKLKQAVNLERALRLSDRIGGHIVSGHVDEVVQVKSLTPFQGSLAMVLEGFQPASLRYVMKKGSVTVNGVSLTVNDIKNDSVEIMLIPHTQERTNLTQLTIGSHVNIEFDWMARIILRQFELQE